ncbi:hypothetical protein THI4931_18040 [Pandoraea sputorum]|nr:hypothetical protein THI4931_18040 [Pandoraea sputorum]
MQTIVVLEHYFGSLKIMTMQYMHDVEIARGQTIPRQPTVYVDRKHSRDTRDVEDTVRTNQMPPRDRYTKGHFKCALALEAIFRKFFSSEER